jgi:hypothetical protein
VERSDQLATLELRIIEDFAVALRNDGIDLRVEPLDLVEIGRPGLDALNCARADRVSKYDRIHHNGAEMGLYFLFGAIGQCPQRGDHRFSGPALLSTDTAVTCHKCGHVCTVEAAVTAALETGAVKKLSDHRVIGRSAEPA